MASADLREQSEAIAERWQQQILATYAEPSARAFQREKNPFANPVGHALRTGTRAAVERLAEGRTPAEVAAALDEIIRIRAVQEFKPSQAVAFVFLLKDAMRADGGTAGSTESANLDRQIDPIALAAFDIYMHYREQICDLRIREIKRSIGMAGKGNLDG